MFIESETIELKTVVTNDICKEVIAFANTKGGKLYIGVDDSGKVIGLEDTDDTILKINNMIRDSIKPDVTMFVGYENIDIAEKKVLEVTVQKGTDRPYYLASKGLKPSGVYVRNGTSCDPATETGIRMMIKETDGDCYEDMRSLEQDLTFKVAENEFSRRNVEFDKAKMVTLGMVSKEDVYTNLGFLLSDQYMGIIKAAMFAGKTKSDFQDRREFTGSVFKQMEEVYSYLELHNQTKATFEGLYRTDKKSYPEEALREALMNCIVHRDYGYSASTLISIFEDRIELVSIGGLPFDIELEDTLVGISVARNPKLANIFYRLELIEAYGTGIPKIMSAYENTGLMAKIEATANTFKITLPNLNGAKVVMPSASNVEEQVLTYIASNRSITRGETETLLNTSQATSNRILKKMLAKGLILQEGNGKNTKYIRGN